jgi:hypothetical protein
MIFEDIFEPVEVIAHFKGGKLHPLRFKWKGRVYKVFRIDGHWVSSQGYNKQHHFSVMADTSDRFELLFNGTYFDWQLARVCLDG